MTDLALEIARRNARLRAWRAYGVPIDGEWQLNGGWIDLAIACIECGVGRDEGDLSDEAGPSFEDLAAWERAAVKRLLESDAGYFGYFCSGCLAPLLSDPPPEVETLTQLELLAGDAP